MIRASAFITIVHARRKTPRIAFLMAGRELCRIKLDTQPRTRWLTEDMYNSLKPRKSTKRVGEDDELDSRDRAAAGGHDDEDRQSEDDFGIDSLITTDDDWEM